MKRQHGFTLYELLVTLLVIGVVLTVGIPNLSDFSRSSRITGIANDLHSSFMVARSEAARAKTNISICASTDPSGAAACDGASFEDGWIIFLDLNGNVARDGADEHVLRSHAAIVDTIDIITNPAATYFSFAANGLGRGDVGVGSAFETAVICGERGHEIAAGGLSAARRIVVTPIGRSVVIRDFDLIDAAGGCP